MKLVTYVDLLGRPAVGVELPEGVMPTGFADLKDLIVKGPDELSRLADAADRPTELVQPARVTAPI